MQHWGLVVHHQTWLYYLALFGLARGHHQVKFLESLVHTPPVLRTNQHLLVLVAYEGWLICL